MLSLIRTPRGHNVFFNSKENCGIIDVRLSFMCGSAHELTPQEYGAAHFLEHMLFQGTKDKNSFQVAREMTNLGYYNAFTNNFQTSYYFTSIKENFKEGLKCLSESVFGSILPEKEFEKEKQVILEELRMSTNDPDDYFHYSLYEKFYGSKLHWIHGTEDSISNMTTDTIRKFYNRYYNNSNMFVILSGGFKEEDTAAIMDTVDNLVPLVKPNDSSVMLDDVVVEPEFHGNIHKINTDKFDVTKVLMKFQWNNEDNTPIGFVRKKVFNQCLNSTLYEIIRDKHGLCYSVHAVIEKMGGNKSHLAVMTTTEKPHEFIDRTYLLLEEMKKNGFDQEIFQAAKSNFMITEGFTKEFSGKISGIIESNINSRNPIDEIVNTTNYRLSDACLKDTKAMQQDKDFLELFNSIGGNEIFIMDKGD